MQLSAVRKDPWDPDCGFLVAARSLYKVQFLTANQEVLFVNPLLKLIGGEGFRIFPTYISSVFPCDQIPVLVTRIIVGLC